jgi:hypothetical protein
MHFHLVEAPQLPFGPKPAGGAFQIKRDRAAGRRRRPSRRPAACFHCLKLLRPPVDVFTAYVDAMLLQVVVLYSYTYVNPWTVPSSRGGGLGYPVSFLPGSKWHRIG